MLLLVLVLLGGSEMRGIRSDPNISGSGEWSLRTSQCIGLACDHNPVAPLFFFANTISYQGYAPRTGVGTDGCHATLTGGKGEVATFTRATTRFCPADSNESSGVMCASGEACIEGGGISMFPFASTNLSLQSETFDNASWTKETGVTVSANDPSCPVAPDTNQTMDLVTFAGASGTGIKQASVVTAGAVTRSLWIAKKTGGAACSLGLTDSVESLATTTLTAAAGPVRWGNTSTEVGTSAGIYLKEVTAGDCTDVCVWGGQTEVGAIKTPYVKTTTVAATRNTESLSVAVTYGGAGAPQIELTGSAACTVIPQFTAASGLNGWVIGHRGNSRFIYYSGTNYLAYEGTTNPAAANNFVANVSQRVYNTWPSATASASSLNGVTAYTRGASGYSDVDTQPLRIGEQSGVITGTSGLILKDCCVDTDATRCTGTVN